MGDLIKNARRIVFKIGSSTLMQGKREFDGITIHRLTALWSSLHNEGKDIILVTSGAIGLGWGDLGLKEKPKGIPEKQAAAAVGQTKLMNMYRSFFSPCNIGIGQILLTRDDIADRHRYLNARNTLNVLINDGIVPIINENDTVAFDEIKFGENDTLATMVGGLIDADLVILLSDIDGLYTADPRKDPNATLIQKVEDINEDILALAGGVGTDLGSGGMKSKVEAAKIAGDSGIPLVITDGKNISNLEALFQSQGKCTVFYPHKESLRHKDRWIAHGSSAAGYVVADQGAILALHKGKSLLPVGVIAVEGDFHQGDVIAVRNSDGKEIARGITNFNTADAKDFMGKKCTEQNEIYEIIHCNNLVLKD